MKYLLAAILILSPALSLAASDFNLGINPANQIQIPQPVKDLFQTFGKINIDFGQNQVIQRLGQDIQQTASNPGIWLSQVKDWWGAINNWLQAHVGVSFKEILTAIGNLFVWVFEQMIKLIKLALPNIQSS